MDNTKTMQKGIALLEKQISLRQIAIRSGINYITLRKIKSGDTKNVSSGVMARFETFQKDFDPAAVGAKKKPGPKPKAAAKKKPGPKPKAADASAAAPARKKPGPKPKTAAVAAPAKRKPGRPKRSAAVAAPAKKTATRRGRKPGPKTAASPKIVAEKATNFGSPLLGEALTREIEIAEARIEYLKSLQMVEEEFLRAIGKK